MKKILGLDLGTNSIGWALIEVDHKKGIVRIIGLGSRILPMDAREIKTYAEGGKIISTAAQRTEKRGPRRLNERFLLRRDRLHLILNLLEALPEHYKLEIDFTNVKGEKCGQFKENKEPKLAYLPKQKGHKAEFHFKESYQEMLDKLGIENKKGSRIPYDWTLYYLRNKALSEKISLEEFAWVLLSYNQKRGYQKVEALEEYDELGKKLEEFGLTKSIQESIDTSKLEIESMALKVVNIEQKEDKNGKYSLITLNNDYKYKEYCNEPLTIINDNSEEIKNIERLTFYDENGDIDKERTIYKIDDIYDLKVENVELEKTEKQFKYHIKYSCGWLKTYSKTRPVKAFFERKDKTEEVISTNLFNNNGEPIKVSTQKINDRKELILKINNKSITPYKIEVATDNSNWKLLKKKTEKDAIKFNSQNNFIDKNGHIKKYISPLIYNTLKNDAKSNGYKRTKIIGGRFQVVEREFYRAELNQIIATQKQSHNQLKDREIFEKCVKTLYPKNETHANVLLANKYAIQHLLVEDILLYQRDLDSKKSEIANCKYEVRYFADFVNKETGEIKKKEIPVFCKAIPVSHPLFQEFRIWDKIHNLNLIQLEKYNNQTHKKDTNVDITKDAFTNEFYIELFKKINSKSIFNQNDFLTFCKEKLPLDGKKSDYVWNYPADEEFKGNETRTNFKNRFARNGLENVEDFLTQEKEFELWHYLYSVSYKERTAKDKEGNENANLKKFLTKYFKEIELPQTTLNKLIIEFANFPKFDLRYGAYSEKALKKLLPFMRIGKNNFEGEFDISEFESDLENIGYDAKNITSYLGLTKERLKSLSKDNRKKLEKKKQSLHTALWKDSINKRIDEILKRKQKIYFDKQKNDYIYDDAIDNNQKPPFPRGLFNAFWDFEKPEDFTQLNLTQASYLVYGRHSELAQAKYWKKPQDIRDGIKEELKQHSLNNAVAEKVLIEMMQVVADIWEYKQYGNSQEKYFSEIHIEVGRELKKNAKQKQSAQDRQDANRKQNKRIRKMLNDFLSENPYNAKPTNSDHFDRLKILENSALNQNQFNSEEFYKKEKLATNKVSKDSINTILNSSNITKEDFDKYRLWIEQGYRSPYSGEMIKLTDLFNGDKYNIDHVFPQALVINDSLDNKVVCETALNQLKDDRTGRAFIQEQKGVPHLGIKVCSEDEYLGIVNKQFSNNKRFILTSKDIPKGFVSSQLNTSRYIARKAMELLSHIVRENDEIEYKSKNVLPVTGAVTSKLKKAWQLTHVWNDLMSPRFKRMNELTGSSLFGSEKETKEGHKYFKCQLDDKILEDNPDFDIKRIDHRHHALDALIIALCTKEHVQYINNENAGINTKKIKSRADWEKLKAYRLNLKRKVKWSEKDEKNPENKNWYYMMPGEYRISPKDKYSGKDTVKSIDFIFNNTVKNTKERGHKAVIFEALSNVITSFKQNTRVINRSVNQIQKWDIKENKKVLVREEEKDLKNSKHWTIRRSLGKDTFYGRVNLKRIKKKFLYSSIKDIYNKISIVVDKEMKEKLKGILLDNDLNSFKKSVKKEFPDNPLVELYYFTDNTTNDKKVASREFLSDKFDSKRIKEVTDTGIQKILLNHLKQYDTVGLEFEDAIQFYDILLEKPDFEAIISNNNKGITDSSELIQYLQENNYKYDNVNFSKLNVFIENISERDFRNEKAIDGANKYDIKEHPELAFTPEVIDDMNKPENIRKLNIDKKGKERNHAPIKKVRLSTGFGKQRQVSEDEDSVKSKQYVVNDAGSNLFLGVYELKDKSLESKTINKRLFKNIDLIDLIKFQKTNKLESPFEEKIFEKDIEYILIFTLSPDDIVSIKNEEKESYFTLNNFTDSKVYFRPINHSSEIIKTEIDKRFDFNKKTIIGSQVNKTEYCNNIRIKDFCKKVTVVNRLGNISKV